VKYQLASVATKFVNHESEYNSTSTFCSQLASVKFQAFTFIIVSVLLCNVGANAVVGASGITVVSVIIVIEFDLFVSISHVVSFFAFHSVTA